MKQLYFVLLATFLIGSCQPNSNPDTTEEATPVDSGLSITEGPFGELDGQEVVKYTLKNKNGMELSFINYGGILTNLIVPDRNGVLLDVTLGFDSLAGYTGEHAYFGSLVGRYGNRIANGQFTIDGVTYDLAKNNAPNSLHGGVNGFHRQFWTVKKVTSEESVSLELGRTSLNMEEGFPGNLDVFVRYSLNNNNEWTIDYTATSDQKTPVNLTQHAYFNLNGAGNGDILGHQLMLNASQYTPVDETLIPTGELASVENTPFDFRSPTLIGARIEVDNQQLKHGGGYDHNWVINGARANKSSQAAALYAPESGIFMEVYTSEPGIQFYCGNFLDGSLIGKGGKPYQKRTGLCLETQHFPDSPNQENFPNTIIGPGQIYNTQTIYAFSVR